MCYWIGLVPSDVRRGGEWEGREDVKAIVVNTLKWCMLVLSVYGSDIDRAHRLPGPSNRVCFVCSSEDSVKDNVMTWRLELRVRTCILISR